MNVGRAGQATAESMSPARLVVIPQLRVPVAAVRAAPLPADPAPPARAAGLAAAAAPALPARAAPPAAAPAACAGAQAARGESAHTPLSASHLACSATAPDALCTPEVRRGCRTCQSTRVTDRLRGRAPQHACTGEQNLPDAGAHAAAAPRRCWPATRRARPRRRSRRSPPLCRRGRPWRPPRGLRCAAASGRPAAEPAPPAQLPPARPLAPPPQPGAGTSAQRRAPRRHRRRCCQTGGRPAARRAPAAPAAPAVRLPLVWALPAWSLPAQYRFGVQNLSCSQRRPRLRTRQSRGRQSALQVRRLDSAAAAASGTASLGRQGACALVLPDSSRAYAHLCARAISHARLPAPGLALWRCARHLAPGALPAQDPQAGRAAAPAGRCRRRRRRRRRRGCAAHAPESSPPRPAYTGSQTRRTRAPR